MDFAWYLSSFDKAKRTVILECDISTIGFDDIVCDINTLQSLAIENNGCSGKGSLDGEKDNLTISIEVVFSNDDDWKNFCKSFINLQKSDNETE